MIFHDAMKSLKNDFSRSFFYWLTFMLTTMFTFLFFCIATSSEIGLSFFGASTGTVLNVTLFSVAVCVIEVFFANDFFVKTKSKALAIQLICGAKFVQLAEYLLAQTFILLALAIPAGVILSVVLLPIVNMILSSFLGASFSAGITAGAAGGTLFVVIMLVFWTTYLNLAYAYRNNAQTLLNEQGEKNKSQQSFLSTIKLDVSIGGSKGAHIAGFLQKFFWVLLSLFFYIGPLVFIFRNPENIFIFSVANMFGFLLCIKHIINPLLHYLLNEGRVDKPKSVAVLGFLRTDIKIMKVNIILVVLSSVILLSTFVTSNDGAMTLMLILLSYVIINILLSLAVMFKFATDILGRKKYFITMGQLGYTKGALKSIVFEETTLFYIFLMAAVMIPVGAIFIKLVGDGSMMVSMAVFLGLCFVIPMVLCYLVTIVYYMKAIAYKDEK